MEQFEQTALAINRKMTTFFYKDRQDEFNWFKQLKLARKRDQKNS